MAAGLGVSPAALSTAAGAAALRPTANGITDPNQVHCNKIYAPTVQLPQPHPLWIVDAANACCAWAVESLHRQSGDASAAHKSGCLPLCHPDALSG